MKRIPYKDLFNTVDILTHCEEMLKDLELPIQEELENIIGDLSRELIDCYLGLTRLRPKKYKEITRFAANLQGMLKKEYERDTLF